MDLAIARTEHDDTVVLACTGRLDAETGDELARAVADELRRGLHAIRLDLADVSFLSSAGIRGLFETQIRRVRWCSQDHQARSGRWPSPQTAAALLQPLPMVSCSSGTPCQAALFPSSAAIEMRRGVSPS